MKLLRLVYLTLLVMAPGLYAMEQTEEPTDEGRSNTGYFATVPLELLSRIADIANNCDPDCDCGCCGEQVLDWKDINNIQRTCKFLQKYFVNQDREIVADFCQKRLESETVETFLNRVLIFLLKVKLYPHKNSITLILSDNSLAEDGPALEKFFKNLDTFGLAERITDLQLLSNNLTTLPNQICWLKNLEYLDMSANLLTAAEAKKVCALTKLRSLNLNSNILTVVPEDIGALGLLEELNLCANHITALPDSIGSLNKLSYIDLSFNQLPSVEIGKIFTIRSLTALELMGNAIAKLPDTLYTMEKLTSLYIDVSELPMTELVKICELTQLQNLELDQYALPTLPDNIRNLKNLTSLTIGRNANDIGFEDLDNPDLPKMQGSELTKLCGLQNLRSLAITLITLSSLPKELAHLQKLTCLTLCATSLSIAELTKACQLPNLESLDLMGNLLTGLPDTIGSLHNLKELHLMFNNIPPAELAKLSTLVNLEILDIGSNNLTGLPAELAGLHNLKILELLGNPIEQNDYYALLVSQLPADLQIMI